MVDERSTHEYDYSPVDRALAQRLFETHYDDLLRVARAMRKRAGRDLSMLTGEIVHECWFKLERREEWTSQEHFLRTATLAIRQITIDRLRRHIARKTKQNGSLKSLDELDENVPRFSETPEDVVMIGDLLDTLRTEKPQWMRIVDMRYFTGLTETETAELLGVSERTVRRHWTEARAWLADRLAENV